MKNKLSKRIKKAIRKRVAVTKQWFHMDSIIAEYCKRAGLNTEYIYASKNELPKHIKKTIRKEWWRKSSGFVRTALLQNTANGLDLIPSTYTQARTCLQ